jgi:hypothetical protein
MTLPADDARVDDETLVYRWVPRDQIVADPKMGRYRPSTNAFHNTTGTDRMSVLLGDTLAAQHRDPASLPDALRTLGSLATSFVRQDCGQEVNRSPTPTELAHGDVVGSDSKKIRSKMAREAACVEGDWADATP